MNLSKFDVADLSPIQPEDAYFMNLALQQAQQGELTTRPNPAVGCVLVKNHQIIASGFHQKAGTAHAEAAALHNAQSNQQDVQEATVYVTLEPCNHTGKTPPCTQALIDAKVSRVVVACTDSNPQVSGLGIQKLLKSGIKVTVGVCEDKARALNAGFLKAMVIKMPYVRLKVAASLDGRTAMEDGESKWITSIQSRQDVQYLRAKSGAIITGSGTIIADNPALTVRFNGLGTPLCQIPKPKIVVVDRQGRLNYQDDYQVFTDKNTLLWRDELPNLLHILATQYQCYDVLVEAGSKLSGAFIAQNLVDELIVYQAPCLLGTKSYPMFEFGLEGLAWQKRFDLIEVHQLGGDLKMVFHPLA